MYQRPVMCKISVPGVIFIHEPPATLSVYETLTWLYKPISIHQISPPSSHCIVLIGQLVPFIFIDKISVSNVLNKLSSYHHRPQTTVIFLLVNDNPRSNMMPECMTNISWLLSSKDIGQS